MYLCLCVCVYICAYVCACVSCEGVAYSANLWCFSELVVGLLFFYALGRAVGRAEHSKHEFRVGDSLCRLFCRVGV